MPKPLAADVLAELIGLRKQGVKATEVAQRLGISRAVVYKHAPSMRPAPLPKVRRGRPAGRQNYFDDPRFPPTLDNDPYADVVPIPFFPADLPRLTKDPFWTPARLQWALSQRT